MDGTPELTLEVRYAVFDAYAEARRLSDDHINTEHLLLGMLKDEGNEACLLLHRWGFAPDDVRALVEKHLCSRYGRTRLSVPLTPRAERVLKATPEWAKKLNSSHVQTTHLLLALLEEKQGPAELVLSELGVSEEKVLEALQAYRLPQEAVTL